MRTLCVDVRRAFCTPWFVATVTASLVLLWVGLGPSSNALSEQLAAGYRPYWHLLLYTTLTSPTSALTLPVLGAMPYAGQGLLELSSGAFRSALPRAGHTAYCASKVVACCVSAMTAQVIALGVAVLWGIWVGAYDADYLSAAALLSCMAARLLGAGFWALVAGAVAVFTRVSTSVYVAPMAISFALSLIGRRLFAHLPQIDPANWLLGGSLLLQCGLLVAAGVLYYSTFKGATMRHA